MNHNPPPPRDQARDRRILRSFAEGRTVENLALHHDMTAIEVTHLLRRAVAGYVNGTQAPTAPPLPTVAASPPAPAAQVRDRLAELLAAAAASTSTRIQRQGEKLDAAVTALGQVIAEEKAAAEREAKEAAARKEAEERLAKARAELEAAEAALRQAKGKPTRTSKPTTPSPAGNGGTPPDREVRAWAVATGVPCSPRGRVSADVTAAYLAAHQGAAA